MENSPAPIESGTHGSKTNTRAAPWARYTISSNASPLIHWTATILHSFLVITMGETLRAGTTSVNLIHIVNMSARRRVPLGPDAEGCSEAR